MRYPVASIRFDCGINRISVSHDHHVLAVPLDNRHIRLYDLGGNRIANLPHRNRKVSNILQQSCSLLNDCYGVTQPFNYLPKSALGLVCTLVLLTDRRLLGTRSNGTQCLLVTRLSHYISRAMQFIFRRL